MQKQLQPSQKSIPCPNQCDHDAIDYVCLDTKCGNENRFACFDCLKKLHSQHQIEQLKNIENPNKIIYDNQSMIIEKIIKRKNSKNNTFTLELDGIIKEFERVFQEALYRIHKNAQIYLDMKKTHFQKIDDEISKKFNNLKTSEQLNDINNKLKDDGTNCKELSNEISNFLLSNSRKQTIENIKLKDIRQSILIGQAESMIKYAKKKFESINDQLLDLQNALLVSQPEDTLLIRDLTDKCINIDPFRTIISLPQQENRPRIALFGFNNNNKQENLILHQAFLKLIKIKNSVRIGIAEEESININGSHIQEKEALEGISIGQNKPVQDLNQQDKKLKLFLQDGDFIQIVYNQHAKMLSFIKNSDQQFHIFTKQFPDSKTKSWRFFIELSSGCEVELVNDKLKSIQQQQYKYEIVQVRDLDSLDKLTRCQQLDYFKYSLSISLNRCKIDEARLVRFTSQLKHFKQLRKLSLGLCGVGIDNKIISQISKALSELKSLKALELGFGNWAVHGNKNKIDTLGCKEICQILTNNNKLIQLSLDFSQNLIKDEGVKAISDGLSNNKGIRTLSLYLKGNQITDDGANYLSEAIKQKSIKINNFIIDMSNNELKNQGALALANAFQMQSDLSYLELNLRKNQIENQGVITLRDVCDRIKNLKKSIVNLNEQIIEIDLQEDAIPNENEYECL